MFEQGDVGNNFYIILKGAVEVVINDTVMITLDQAGTGFGELALIEENNKRMATIRTAEDCRFALLSRKDFTIFLKRVNQQDI